MSRVFIPNKWDENYYPTANDLVYEVPASTSSTLDLSTVIVKDKFPITDTRKYLYRGADRDFDYSGSVINFKLEPGIISEPKYGVVEHVPGVGFKYTPRAGFLGKDTFRYQLLVTKRSSNIGTVEVFVGVQAKFPTCSTTYEPVSGIVQEGAAVGSQIYLCKPAYSEFTIGLPIAISEYVGELAESSDPVPVTEVVEEVEVVIGYKYPNKRFLQVEIKDLDLPIDPDDAEATSVIHTQRYEFDALAASTGMTDNLMITLNRPRLRNFLIIISKGVEVPPEDDAPESEFVEPFVDFTSINLEVSRFSIKLV